MVAAHHVVPYSSLQRHDSHEALRPTRGATLTSYGTEQENFWSSEFGNEYSQRNNSDQSVVANIALFTRILARASGVTDILELGANIGLNLIALHTLLPNAHLSGIEINESAADRLQALNFVNVIRGSILGHTVAQKFDLVFTKGVLIHIDPSSLPLAYEALYNSSRRYVVVAEYFNPTPVEVSYRGHSERLFKRDFAGELLDTYPDLKVRDYGFVWSRDAFPQDDLTWFLLEKSSHNS